MPKVPYYPFDETLDAIFKALGISISSDNYGGNKGWAPEDLTYALGLANEMLVDYETFEFDGDPEDDLDEAWEILDNLNLDLHYWSTEKAIDAE